MAAFKHPDARAEQAHLNDTLALIARETEQYAANEARLKNLVDTLRVQAAGAFDTDLFVQEIVYRNVRQTLLGLVLSKDTPYFTRVDFIERGAAHKQTHYIGKYSVTDSLSLDTVVVDWRSPIANLYYAGQLGPVHYDVPDGAIHGELVLKRQFDIAGGALRSFFDADMVSQDKLLHEALSVVGAERLREVVTTIQAEQNAVIRFPMKNLIIQGVAGSGKTTIALHRIAYMLYAHRETLAPRSLMILAPNPLFLSYIADVLPELGVEDAVQTTFDGLARTLMEERLPGVLNDERLPRALADAPYARQLTEGVRFKGALAYIERLAAFMDEVERSIVPEGDIRFGPVGVFKHEDLEQFFLTDHAMFPWNTRIAAVHRSVKKRGKVAMEQVRALIMGECEKRAETLKAAMPDGPERRARLTTLYDSRDARLKEAKEAVAPFVKAQAARWHIYTPVELYRMFLERLKVESDPALAAVADETMAALSKKRIEQEDVAALLYIDKRLNGFDAKLPIQHVVIDEAQDLSPNQFGILKQLFPNITFTIVGDMGQSIMFYKGVRAWSEAADAIGAVHTQTLTVSYRNTVEIMTLANAVARRHAYDGQVFAQPVLRHGEKPRLLRVQSPKERIAAILDTIDALHAEGYRSIALIERTQAQARDLHKALNKVREGSAEFISDTVRTYTACVLATDCASVKGLEFDAVVIADAGAQQYADTQEDMRLIYVALTRPLHRLTVIYSGELSPLFTEAEGLLEG